MAITKYDQDKFTWNTVEYAHEKVTGRTMLFIVSMMVVLCVTLFPVQSALDFVVMVASGVVLGVSTTLIMMLVGGERVDVDDWRDM